MSAFMSAERLGGILNAPGTSASVKEHEHNPWNDQIPEMESSVSVALSYSLSSESVQERMFRDKTRGGGEGILYIHKLRRAGRHCRASYAQ